VRRLQKLRADLQSIPSKRKRAVLVERLTVYADKVSEVVQTFEQSVAEEHYALSVFPELSSGSVAENRGKAKGVATRVERRLRKDIGSVEQSRTETEITNLGEYADRASKSVRNRWETHLGAKIQGYETLLTAAKQAGLVRVQQVASALAFLQQRIKSPPLNGDEADTIRGSLDQLTESISQLGLEGEAGDFVVAASQGGAAAEDLLTPEVREFIDRHDLWRFLRVTFR
jgi:hypothetical protein